MRRLPALSAVLCTAGLAACGGDGDRADSPPADARTPSGTPTPAPNPARPRADPQGLPPGVPSTPRRDRTSDEDRVVIDAWLRALRDGDIEKAASYFALPSKVQNGTPVLTLRTPSDRLVWNASFPCGAKVTQYGSGDGFTVLEFELTERVGGDCGSGTGGTARGAIKVDDGRITEWYRLADDAGSDPAPVPEIDPGTAREA